MIKESRPGRIVLKDPEVCVESKREGTSQERKSIEDGESGLKISFLKFLIFFQLLQSQYHNIPILTIVRFKDSNNEP